MIDTLWGLALACVAFFGVHLLPGVPGLRAVLVARLGRTGYRGAFSLVSACGLGWLIVAHMHAPDVPLWAAPAWTRLVPLAAMLPALVLLVGTRSEGMQAVTRHPMLWAVLLWALVHIPANGDAAALLLFGGFALYALIAMPLGDGRLRREEPERWRALAETSSALPFAAIAAGRARLSLRAIGTPRLALALLLTLAALFAHAHVIGVSALPG